MRRTQRRNNFEVFMIQLQFTNETLHELNRNNIQRRKTTNKFTNESRNKLQKKKQKERS